MSFLAAAAPVWAVVLATWLWLRRQEPTAPVGWATALTLLRGLLLGALAGTVGLPGAGWTAWLPGALYTTAALIDLVDGWVARRLDEVTALGARLDVAFDALGLLVAPIAGVWLGRLPPWYLVLGLAYYLFQAALWLRARRGLPLFRERLRPMPHARMFAGYQMGLVATVLFPVLPPPGTWIAATAFMLPTLALFGWEWLVVTDRWRPSVRQARRWALSAEVLRGLLPVVRLVVAAGLGALVWRAALPTPVLALAALIAAGVVTRLSSYAAAAALTAILPGTGPLALATFLAALLLLLAGGGRAVLWNPEDRWLLVRPGIQPRAARARDLRAPSVGT